MQIRFRDPGSCQPWIRDLVKTLDPGSCQPWIRYLGAGILSTLDPGSGILSTLDPGWEYVGSNTRKPHSVMITFSSDAGWMTWLRWVSWPRRASPGPRRRRWVTPSTPYPSSSGASWTSARSAPGTRSRRLHPSSRYRRWVYVFLVLLFNGFFSNLPYFNSDPLPGKL